MAVDAYAAQILSLGLVGTPDDHLTNPRGRPKKDAAEDERRTIGDWLVYQMVGHGVPQNAIAAAYNLPKSCVSGMLDRATALYEGQKTPKIPRRKPIDAGARDPDAVRGVPVVGRGIPGGAIKGSRPGLDNDLDYETFHDIEWDESSLLDEM